MPLHQLARLLKCLCLPSQKERERERERDQYLFTCSSAVEIWLTCSLSFISTELLTMRLLMKLILAFTASSGDPDAEHREISSSFH